MTRRARCLAAACAAALLAVGGAATLDAQRGGEALRVVAIGDIHGAYPQLLEVLQTVGLTDRAGRWTGGASTLVQTGDFTDRGANVRGVMDVLMALERQAEEARGRVVVLLGNHETMNLTSLLQDTSAEAVATFIDERSERRRADGWRRYERFLGERRRQLGREPPGVMTEEAWMEAHPPGLIEYLEAFGPRGTYGRWLRRKDVAVEIDGTVFLHGGLRPDLADESIRDVNRRARREIERWDDARRRLEERDVILPFFTFYEVIEAARVDLETWVERLQSPAALDTPPTVDREYLEMLLELLKADSWSIIAADGPLWFRGYDTWTDEEGAPLVERLSVRYGARRFVVGHTPQNGFRITARFANRVFLIDTGMLTEVYRGRPSALEIVGDRVTARYLDESVPLATTP